MTAEQESPQLHHVVFAVAPERHAAVAQLFTDLGFTLQPAELTELGLRIHLDWDRGIELISAVPGSTASVAASVNEFLDKHGDGVATRAFLMIQRGSLRTACRTHIASDRRRGGRCSV